MLDGIVGLDAHLGDTERAGGGKERGTDVGCVGDGAPPIAAEISAKALNKSAPSVALTSRHSGVTRSETKPFDTAVVAHLNREALHS